MKFNFPLTIISVLITLLLSFYFYNESKDIILLIGIIISSLSIFGPSLIYINTNSKISVNVRVISLITFFVSISIQLLKINKILGDNFYVLSLGFIIIIYLLTVYTINKTNI